MVLPSAAFRSGALWNKLENFKRFLNLFISIFTWRGRHTNKQTWRGVDVHTNKLTWRGGSGDVHKNIQTDLEWLGPTYEQTKNKLGKGGRTYEQTN